MGKKKEKLSQMLAIIESIIENANQLEMQYSEKLALIHPNWKESARNLIHYRALRMTDIRDLQKQLGNMGFSRLAKAEGHVMASLRTTRNLLKALIKDQAVKLPKEELSIKKARKQIKSNAKALLGYRSKSRRTRIMVTLPTEAATNFELVKSMIASGMNCARINCAHDGPEVWLNMIKNVRKASQQLSKNCKIAMDLAGPKIRTGALEPGPQVRKVRPPKNLRGEIIQAVNVWLGPDPNPALPYPHIPLPWNDLQDIEVGAVLKFKDARIKKRKLTIIERLENGLVAACDKTTYFETGIPIYKFGETSKDGILTGTLPHLESSILLKTGEDLILTKSPEIGHPAQYNEEGQLIAPATISTTAPAIFDQVKSGEPILFDDGKIEGLIRAVKEGQIFVEIIHAADGVAKLRADKGINLPNSQLKIRGLTAKDRKDLRFVVEYADVVNMSFVNQPSDVRDLINAVEELDRPAERPLGVILKIETQSGFNNLLDILLEAMRVDPLGVMIARGDLAIECGWNNIGRVQEEILTLCQAGHVPDIWATQVLENLAKRGIPSRAEITDAAMAQRAECVMLNKGKYITEAISLLDTILKDLEPYREKNAPLSPPLQLANTH